MQKTRRGLIRTFAAPFVAGGSDNRGGKKCQAVGDEVGGGSRRLSIGGAIEAGCGLFVDPKKGPVLLNYGIDEARFTKPVYPGATLGVRLTVKEKIAQEKISEEDVPKGIVKFLVDVYDETGETVALATILTMVQKRSD